MRRTIASLGLALLIAVPAVVPVSALEPATPSATPTAEPAPTPTTEPQPTPIATPDASPTATATPDATTAPSASADATPDRRARPDRRTERRAESRGDRADAGRALREPRQDPPRRDRRHPRPSRPARPLHRRPQGLDHHVRPGPPAWRARRDPAHPDLRSRDPWLHGQAGSRAASGARSRPDGRRRRSRRGRRGREPDHAHRRRPHRQQVLGDGPDRWHRSARRRRRRDHRHRHRQAPRPQRGRWLQLLDQRPLAVARQGGPRHARGRHGGRARQHLRGRRRRAGSPAVGRQDPQRRRLRPAVLVRLRPRLGALEEGPQRREPSAHRGGQHERHQVGLRRPRLRDEERGHPPQGDLPGRRGRHHRRRRCGQ